MAQQKRGRVSRETFDEFLMGQDMLESCESSAIKEIVEDQLDAAMKSGSAKQGTGTPSTDQAIQDVT